jgi:hypothetical protein
MPVFEYLKIWDFYPDLSSKTIATMDGYFVRKVMSRSQVLALSKREDFFKDRIKSYLSTHVQGNYTPLEFEQELRVMGIRTNVNEMKAETSKFEVLRWKGKLGGSYLVMAGIPVEEDKLADELDAEIWMIGDYVIGAKLNPYAELGIDVKTLHYFVFDEDDTSPIGYGLPNIMRDTQMCLSAAVRMLMDNASVTCGPQLEINTDLLRGDQDLKSISGYKIWYREGEGVDAQWPAVRDVKVDAHLDDLLKIVDLFLKFADMETFVGPATGGDMDAGPSEPFRTAAGASMLRGDAALPFKDIVRSYDRFTQSVILSLVLFNRQFNPDQTSESDYNVIARGATSLIAKEIRGMQVDQLAQTLTPEEKLHLDMRKFAEIRFKIRDLSDLLVSEDEAARREAAQNQAQGQQQQQQSELIEAQIREALASAFSKIAQGQKNSATANAEAINTALALLEAGVNSALGGGSGAQQGGSSGGGQSSVQPQGATGNGPSAPAAGGPAGGGQGQPAPVSNGPGAASPGAGFGLQ